MLSDFREESDNNKHTVKPAMYCFSLIRIVVLGFSNDPDKNWTNILFNLTRWVWAHVHVCIIHQDVYGPVKCTVRRSWYLCDLCQSWVKVKNKTWTPICFLAWKSGWIILILHVYGTIYIIIGLNAYCSDACSIYVILVMHSMSLACVHVLKRVCCACFFFFMFM